MTESLVCGTITYDDFCLDSMRQMVKEYIVYRQQYPSEEHA